MTLRSLGAPRGWRIVGAACGGAVVAAVAAGAFAQDRAPPFSSIYRRPSVSPYTMMGAGGGVGGAAGFNPLIYQQLVQPRFQQEQAEIQQMQQGRTLGSLQSQVNSLGRGAARIEQTIRPTGHSTTFQNLSHFYPGR